MPALVAVVSRDSPNHVLSYEADRALLHFLRLKDGGGGAGAAPPGLEAEAARFLAGGDYVRKLRKRVADEESDDETI